MHHRLLAIWIIAAALVMKAVVPAGFMPMASAGKITIVLCSGYGPQTMTMAMPGMSHGGEGKGDSRDGDQGKVEQPCAFSGLSTVSLAAADPIILALVIAFIVAAVFRGAAATLAWSPFHLRPPLRGPPAAA